METYKMNIQYDDNWNVLIEYLEDRDSIFFVREGVIELILESEHVFIYRGPVVFKCKVIPFPYTRINKDILDNSGILLDFRS